MHQPLSNSSNAAGRNRMAIDIVQIYIKWTQLDDSQYLIFILCGEHSKVFLRVHLLLLSRMHIKANVYLILLSNLYCKQLFVLGSCKQFWRLTRRNTLFFSNEIMTHPTCVSSILLNCLNLDVWRDFYRLPRKNIWIAANVQNLVHDIMTTSCYQSWWCLLFLKNPPPDLCFFLLDLSDQDRPKLGKTVEVVGITLVGKTLGSVFSIDMSKLQKGQLIFSHLQRSAQSSCIIL